MSLRDVLPVAGNIARVQTMPEDLERIARRVLDANDSVTRLRDSTGHAGVKAETELDLALAEWIAARKAA